MGVYFVGVHNPQGSGRTQLLSRIPEVALVSFDWTPMEFLGKDGLWSKTVTDSYPMYAGPYTEGSLHYHPTLKYYRVGGQAYQRQVYIYTAPVLTGPWTAHHVFDVEPLGSGYIAYAAKAHPELSNGRDVVVTYNVNGPHSNMSIYYPIFIRVPWREQDRESKFLTV